MVLLLIYHIHNLLKDLRKTFDLMFKTLITVDKTLHWRIRKSDKTYFYLNSLNMLTWVIYSENKFHVYHQIPLQGWKTLVFCICVILCSSYIDFYVIIWFFDLITITKIAEKKTVSGKITCSVNGSGTL